ncbi:MAG: diguanylate cyclase [Gallionella sp.]|nr:diguanylate cyclase [Gallionella sp.]
MVDTADILNASILIVDDSEANILLLKRLLSSVGYVCVTSTKEPNEVCGLHLKNRYDLILLDLQMPGMDGFQVMEGLKKIESGSYLPVLVMTANPDHKLRALAAGAKDFLSRPFDLMEAKTRIHNMLEVRLLYKQLEHSSDMMKTMALHDALTGLPNRRLLMDRLSLSIVQANRRRGMMAVLYLDLDGFKQVNDTLGHDAGDTLLKMVSDRLVAAVREEDTVARLGGDEFVIVLSELSNADDIARLAPKMIQAVSQPYSIQEHSVNITVSIGISIFPTHGTDAESLMKSADLALYEAKHAGKNAYRLAISTAPQAATHN